MLTNTGSIIRYESWESTRQGSLPQFISRLRLDVAKNLAAAFDLDLAVADRPRDPAGRLYQEPVASTPDIHASAAHGSHETRRWREMDSNFRFPAMVSFVVVPFRRVPPIPR
jgi:hypothetical protein